MNGRVFAVNRSPVLAWNVEPPLQVPYPDMPAAAAAAISPVVPAASDPYGRCWQNQVDTSTSYPYFGLYNNSLPPTPYRLQPGCMANLGQFWPPTPPPDGCGRYDGSNLYFGAPVLRHGENIPPNIRNSFQSLGHYSHLVETPKETSQRVFKRETPLSPTVNSNISMSSPVTKSDNLSTYCVVDSKLKTQVSHSSNLSKQENQPVSSGHDSYAFAADARNSSNFHPSTEKSCFSPSYTLRNIPFHNSSQDNSASKANSISGTQENNSNASPLKNVYFSHFESENVNSMLSKNFSKASDGQYRFEHKNNSLDVNKSKLQHQSLNGFILHNTYPPKKHNYQGSPEMCSATPNSMLKADRQSDRMMIVSEKLKHRNSICSVKPEKGSSHSDCKYQKSISKVPQVREFKSTEDSFNIPTSVIQPKIEPNDKYFLTCSSTAPSCMANSYSNSGSYLMSKDFAADLRTSSGYRTAYANSCSLSKPWSCAELSLVSPDSYFKMPEAAKPPVQGTPQTHSPLHDSVISVAQTAPQTIESFRDSTLHPKSHSSSLLKRNPYVPDVDDEVQIIGMQTKQSSCISFGGGVVTEKEYEKIEAVESTSSSNQIIYEAKTAKEEKCSNEINHPTEIKVEDDTSNTDRAIGVDLSKPFADNIECSALPIKKEISEDLGLSINDSIPPPVSVDEKQVEKSLEESNLDETSNENCIVKNDCKTSTKETSLAYNEDHHGLNLLLNTIEKVSYLESSNANTQQLTVVKTEAADEAESYDKCFQVFPATRGLDLLSVIAGQRLVAEFEDAKQELQENTTVKSNYPEIKKEKFSDEDSHKLNDIQVNATKSSVCEMQDRLVELQKKYKQKQKELSRLKPKKRLANTYLKSHLNLTKDESDQFCSSNNESASDIHSSTNSEVQSQDSNVDKELNEVNCRVSIKIEPKSDVESNKMHRRKLPLRKAIAGEAKSEITAKRNTRQAHSVKRLKCQRVSGSPRSTRSLRKITRSSKSKIYKLRNVKESNPTVEQGDVVEICSKAENLELKAASSDCDKSTKVYALRHSSCSSKKGKCSSDLKTDADSSIKSLPSKRKSENPKKFMPSKQSKLSETIIAKHLRNRILFDTSGSMSDDDTVKDGGVPEDLYDALIKCHLGDESKKREIVSKTLDKCDILESDDLGYPEPSLLKVNHLVEKHRLLALEDGLFYAGCIKEIQVSDRYGIALDGQRGNKLHVFTQEELLTQAIVESKPLSSELPEGTRVCAYWSQQYRCLYPGVVGKAPSPSADWSEPRVFVLFDDGDSGQIPTKNIRLLPSDILPALAEQVTTAKNTDVKLKRGKSRTLRCSTSKCSSTDHCDTGNENESKESSCASINESSCDDSCSVDYSLSPSQNTENNNLENCTCSAVNCMEFSKSKKRQRKRSKRKASYHIKFKEDNTEIKDKCEAKLKRHKKYKDKHHKHHHRHHHHRHNHHHHHHHHSKKRKHRRRNGKNLTSQDSENFADHKSRQTFQSQVEAYVDHVDHSNSLSLPQNDHDRA
ncbi:uncharacterized protein LOC129220955 [Uloborus diversus]|uniref:uncharacterized protein LOC129220955 n=1 Tax=Uloborus diversus TaxID=327109 RepID=UPI00240A0B93|nr:uncharacterized protein LOC129220955 [Uloborus diversus]